MPKEKETDRQERIVELLEEMLVWTKAAAVPQVRKTLLDLLKSDEQKKAYFHSDGKRTCDQVAKLAGCGKSTVSEWWKLWVGFGIAAPIGVQRGDRARRIFSPEEFGIDAPQPEENSEAKGGPSDVEGAPNQEEV